MHRILSKSFFIHNFGSMGHEKQHLAKIQEEIHEI
jgi:hypothetical protein